MTRERSSARDSLLPNVTHLIPEYRIVRRRTHDRPPERMLPAATPKRELRTIGFTTPSRSRLHPRSSRFILFCFPACPSGRPVILAICEDVQGVYGSIPASLSAEHPDRESSGATADERREPFYGGRGNRFCRSEPLHTDVQEGHWSYTTRLASESHPKTLLALIARLMTRSRLPGTNLHSMSASAITHSLRAALGVELPCFDGTWTHLSQVLYIEAVVRTEGRHGSQARTSEGAIVDASGPRTEVLWREPSRGFPDAAL